MPLYWTISFCINPLMFCDNACAIYYLLIVVVDICEWFYSYYMPELLYLNFKVYIIISFKVYRVIINVTIWLYYFWAHIRFTRWNTRFILSFFFSLMCYFNLDSNKISYTFSTNLFLAISLYSAIRLHFYWVLLNRS